jgi:hypothetical protein
MLSADMPIEVILASKAPGMIFASSIVAVKPLPIWIVTRLMTQQVFAILESLLAFGADVGAALVRFVRPHVVPEIALCAESGVADSAMEVAALHHFRLGAARRSCGRTG